MTDSENDCDLVRNHHATFEVPTKPFYIEVERTKCEIIIRLRGAVDILELQYMTDWFQYKEITL